MRDLEGLTFKIITDRLGIENLRPAWAALQNAQDYPIIHADIDRYLAVLSNADPNQTPCIGLVKDHNQVVVLLIGVLKPNCIDCKLGYNHLWTPTFSSWSIIYGGVLGHLDDALCNFLTDSLLHTLKSQNIQGIVFERIRTDNPLFAALKRNITRLRQPFYARKLIHFNCLLSSSFDELLSRCSKNRRSVIRKKERKLHAAYPNQVAFKRFSSPDQVSIAVQDMAYISAKTYQSAYGAGVNDDDRTIHLLTDCAQKGWLLAYVLYIQKSPCAFYLAYKYKHICFGDRMGYDPKWAQYSVGTIVLIGMLKDICQEPKIMIWDSDHGQERHKQWPQGDKWQECTWMILSFCPKLIIANLIASVLTALSVICKKITMQNKTLFEKIQRIRRQIKKKKICSPKIGS